MKMILVMAAACVALSACAQPEREKVQSDPFGNSEVWVSGPGVVTIDGVVVGGREPERTREDILAWTAARTLRERIDPYSPPFELHYNDECKPRGGFRQPVPYNAAVANARLAAEERKLAQVSAWTGTLEDRAVRDAYRSALKELVEHNRYNIEQAALQVRCPKEAAAHAAAAEAQQAAKKAELARWSEEAARMPAPPI